MIEPYYQDEHCTIYHGDNLDVLATLSGVGVVITSPPYNLGRSLDDKPNEAVHARPSKFRPERTQRFTEGYDEHDDGMPLAEYAAWQCAVLAACWDALSDDGAIYYNHKPRSQGGRALLPTEYVPEHVTLRQVIIWDRVNQGVCYVPTAYASRHEWFRLVSRSVSAVSDVWRFPPETDDVGHPCPFPMALPARILETAKVNGSVLDPFMGSGTTLRAAKDRGMRAIGIDKSERYCEAAAKRLAQGVLW